MKIGYAYTPDAAKVRQLPKLLKAAGAESFYIDHPQTKRAERNDLFKLDKRDRLLSVRRGDEIILLDRAQLGAPKHAARLIEMAEAVGATVTVCPVEAPPSGKPGPKSDFNPTYEQELRVRRIWVGPLDTEDALDEIAREMGHRFTRFTLYRHVGTRRKLKPMINEAPQQEP